MGGWGGGPKTQKVLHPKGHQVKMLTILLCLGQLKKVIKGGSATTTV